MRDSHGLYDYENIDINVKSVIVDSSGIIYRNKDDVYFVSRK